MAEISKQALVVENNTSFPNNNNGQITPSVLRAFNNDMIDSTVNQIVFNNYSSSVTESLQALSRFTASVAGTNTFTASIAGTNAYTQSNDAKVNSLIAFTSSVLSISALDPLNNSSSSLQLFTASMNNYTASNDAKVNSLIAFTSSVLDISALVPLNNFTASAQLEINALEGFTASIADTNAFTQSIQAEVDDIQAKTGSFATTGSNVFTGEQTLIDAAGNTITLSDISGSLVLVAKTFTSSSAGLAHISASAANQVNLVFKPNNNSGSVIVSGSGNIYTNPTAPTATFVRYMSVGNLAIGSTIGGSGQAVPQISASMAWSPTISNNVFASSVLPLQWRGPVSASASSVSNNVLAGGQIILGSAAGSSFTAATIVTGISNNLLAGSVTAAAFKTPLSASVIMNNNIIGGGAVLNMDSSSISFSGNSIQGQLTVNNSYFPTTYTSASATLGVNGGLYIGTNSIYASGSNATLTSGRTVSNAVMMGTANVISASLNGDNAQVASTILLGQSLVAIGSNTRTVAATAADWGSVFVGRWNSLDGTKDLTAETVFAVGTGTSTSNRKTGFLIDSGSNTFVEGTLNVSGSTTITGSAYGNVVPLTIASSTASMDCSLGNFFTLTLANSVDTHLAATNVRPGQTINLLVTQGNPSGSISYNSTFDFPSGNAYTASTLVSAKDIVSFISFDSTTLYGTAVKNLV